MNESKAPIGYVCVYEFDETSVKILNALIFTSPTEEWVDFVMKNRTQKGFVHEFDIVYGPVANDRVYAAFALFEGGLIDKQTLIRELKTYRLVGQFLFHSDKALRYIKFVEAKEILL